MTDTDRVLKLAGARQPQEDLTIKSKVKTDVISRDEARSGRERELDPDTTMRSGRPVQR